MAFAPIAIIGRSCVLPGALSPAALWENVLAGRDLIATGPDGRRGGYVRGFESVWDPRGYQTSPALLGALDPLFQWVLHGGREALRDAGYPAPAKAGAIIGNLCYPSEGQARYAEGHWRGTPPGDPHNRFSSGLPAHLLAAALGLGAGAFALDAACASSLYAMALACRWLQNGRADLMIAGAVNRCDDRFIHAGFTALRAMSPTGRSRPFHRDADGLMPAEGAAFVVLKRLDDAERDGDRIAGVIRGIGLSNDGRAAGLLVPSAAAQARAMHAAFRMSGLEPRDISLVECHATGTAVGDAIELRSMREVYAGVAELPIGSLKSNFGHAITAAGAAGLLKVLGAMEAGVRPPTLHAGAPLEALADSPFRLLREPEPWPDDSPRRAAVSAFGFGGNNAHLLVEQWQPAGARQWAVPAGPGGDIAIVGIGAIVGDGRDRHDFAGTVLGGEARARRADEVVMPLTGLRVPPRDLDDTLAQQLLILRAVNEALDGVVPAAADLTGVFIGMGCDNEVACVALRETPLNPAMVVGMMPNIVANRINNHFGFAGPSFSVAAEELSGVRALEEAVALLRAGDLDAAVVGAVDLSCEPVHAAAARQVLAADRQVTGDAAIALVLKRAADAARDGDRVYAHIVDATPADLPDLHLGLAPAAAPLTPVVGHAHAAAGLLHVAAAALAIHHRLLPVPAGARVAPWLTDAPRRTAAVTIDATGGQRAIVRLFESDAEPEPLRRTAVPRIDLFAGPSREAVADAVRLGITDRQGAARLVIVFTTAEVYARRQQAALAALASPAPVPFRIADGVYYREEPIVGEVALVFGPAGASYRGMGRDLLAAFPDVLSKMAAQMPALRQASGGVFEADAPEVPSADNTLKAGSFLTYVHAALVARMLKVRTDAAIGLSSGETTALFALGAWTDFQAFYHEFFASGAFEREVGGRFDAVRRAWQLTADEPLEWETWRIVAPVDELRAALADESRVYLQVVFSDRATQIVGDATGCARVIARLGNAQAYQRNYNLAVHTPVVTAFADAWRGMHRRVTRPVPGVRFYAHAINGPYELESDRIADMLMQQAVQTIEFPKVIDRAWQDGVRVFIELGPAGSCAAFVRDILDGRDHVAVALDIQSESSLDQFVRATAQLVAAGVAVDRATLTERLQRAQRTAPLLVGPLKRLSAHPPAPVAAAPPVPAIADAQVMEPAPALPPVLGAAAMPASMPAARPAPDQGDRFQQFAARMTQAHHEYLRLSRAAFEATTRLRAAGSAMLAAPPSPLIDAVGGRVAEATVDAGTAVRQPAPAVAAVSRRPLPASPPALRPGPKWGRRELEILASGAISSVFGSTFAGQDGYTRQVRMPEPPLLLADRVTGIDAEPGVLATGTIWTETDVTPGAWYLHQGRMPAGIMIEAGQADLLLISWMGIDAFNRGERVYRLLGCELTYHGALPRVGDTLAYDIHVDSHASQGDVRLFFFHYDCHVRGELRLSVRQGQAGFFSDQELADSGGVLWDPDEAAPAAGGRIDAPAVRCTRASFSRAQLEAFAGGRVTECFGPGFEPALAHVRTPVIQGGRMLLLDEVTAFDPQGGPWQRGYCRAETRISPDDWFFDGHFKNDPCMPGTLMFEGCLELMAFYITALGYTLPRDGWRFEPVPGVPYQLRCRGQVTPRSNIVVCELFISDVIEGPEPTIYADLLGTVDGVKAFHCRRMGLRLVPGWPLDTHPEAVVPDPPGRRVAVSDGFRFGGASLAACAWGPPSEAFGPLFAVFDGTRRLPRLPGPPYLFMSRASAIDDSRGVFAAGSTCEIEYDVPRDAWYFDVNGTRTMPYCVLLEVALQPCGWLTTYNGAPLQSETDLSFRNLEGTATQLAEIPPEGGTLTTRVRCTSVTATPGMFLESFAGTTFSGETPVYRIETRFGHFSPEALRRQVGLPTSAEERRWFDAPANVAIDLRRRPDAFFAGSARLPGPQLLMIDRLTGDWPGAGAAGLGRMRAEKDVDPGEWFFKAHFFQDPVQPGSLGIEAMIQLLQCWMLHRGMGASLARPRFEPIAIGRPLTWKYRGQAVPHNTTIVTEIEITETGRDDRGEYAVADAWLWVDGVRVYSASGMGMRLIEGSGQGP